MKKGVADQKWQNAAKKKTSWLVHTFTDKHRPFYIYVIFSF